MTPKPRTIGPESEDRRTDKPARRSRADQRRVREAGVESMPDGEAAAEDEAAKARDD